MKIYTTPKWLTFFRAFIVVVFMFGIVTNALAGDLMASNFGLIALIGFVILWTAEDIKSILVRAFTPVEEPDLEETSETKGE